VSQDLRSGDDWKWGRQNYRDISNQEQSFSYHQGLRTPQSHRKRIYEEGCSYETQCIAYENNRYCAIGYMVMPAQLSAIRRVPSNHRCRPTSQYSLSMPQGQSHSFHSQMRPCKKPKLGSDSYMDWVSFLS
jgi:hypothetical protein